MKFYFVLFCAFVLVDYSIEDFVGETDGLLRNSDGANYLLVGPGTLLAGAANRLCLSRLGRATEGTAQLQLDVQAEGNVTQHIARLRKNFPQGYGGCFDMVVPKTLHTKVTLHLRIRFNTMPSYVVDRYWRGVRVLPMSGMVTIQTDRPMYRAGETVKFRILHLKPDLLPVQTPIRRVWVEMPGEVFGGRARVSQWERVRTQLGLTQLEFTLDQYAPKGDWSIHVETDDSGSEAAVETFTVADYTLPNFYLTIQYPARLLRTTPRITWTICVRHVWGEVVRGALTLRAHTDGGATPVRLSARLYGDPCHNHTVDSKKLGFIAAGSDEPTIIVADVAFQEESTRMWKNTSVISKFVEDTVTIEFINKNKMFVSPGLPYKIKMKVTDWNEEPIRGATVKVCRTASNSSGEPDENSIDNSKGATEPCDSVYYTDSKGYIQASFSVPMDLAASFYKIQATVRSTHAQLTLVVRGGDKTHAALGALGSGGRNYVPLYVTYPPNVEIVATTVHFMLVTRGGNIFRWGAITQCPQLPTSSLSVRQTVQPFTKCFTPASSRRLFRLALPARVSHQMCPYSHMLVYFYQDGELVIATKHFKVSECFYNKVMTRWTPSVVTPGNSTRLTITSLGPALCAISVKDVALRHSMPTTTPPNLQTQLVNKLRTFMEMRKNITLRDLPQRSCFRENGISDYSASDYEYLLTTFSTSGMRLITDLLPDLACSNDQPEPLQQPSRTSTYERSYFPESWLWQLQLLSPNGSIEMTLKAPDKITEYETSVICVSRSGVSVAPVEVLKVFQPFFVELEIPKKVRIGEQTQFFYKIYNYLEESIAVTVDIETDHDTGISIRGAKGTGPTSHNICLGVSDVYSVRLGVLGTRVGKWKIAVKAEVLPQMQHFCGSNVAGLFPSDKIMKEIEVDPEGEPTEKHKSSMICTDGDGRYASELTWQWQGNERTVPGTERWLVWVIGDLAGPVDLNADKLLALPLGCGEQNMARLAHNLVALKHMELRGQVGVDLQEKALDNIKSGYARQMRYLHPSGGFSAFGSKDDSPSTWLTAFCLRYLRAARRRMNMDGQVQGLAAAEDWLVSLQMENGCFQNMGQVFHREFKGGLDSEQSNIALTAYVLVSIIEAGTILRPTVVRSASYCLEALYHSSEPIHPYSLALVAYAQTRLERYESEIQERNDINLKRQPKGSVAKEVIGELLENGTEVEETKANRDGRKEEKVDVAFAISRLRGIAKRSEDVVWWEADSLATSIETTAYAILALLTTQKGRSEQGSMGSHEMEQNIELDDASGAVRWLSLHRNSAGGFLSTQDTLVALEAISAWSAATSHPPSNLVVTVAAPGVSQTIDITPKTKHQLHSLVAQAQGDRALKVTARGTGCVLVQATQQYNSLEPVVRFASPFSLHASVKTDGVFDCQNNGSWCRCAAILEVCISWVGRDFPEMAIAEVALPTGYVTDKTLLYKLLDKENLLLRRLEEWEVDSKVVLYLAVKGSYRGGRPRECYDLYLMGPQSKTAPAMVNVYDYYHREVNASQRYIIPEKCPAPIAHTESSYLGSNNIYRQFSRAREINTNETEDLEVTSAEVYPYSLSNGVSQELDDIEQISTVIDAPSYENPPKDLALDLFEVSTNNGHDTTIRQENIENIRKYDTEKDDEESIRKGAKTNVEEHKELKPNNVETLKTGLDPADSMTNTKDAVIKSTEEEKTREKDGKTNEETENIKINSPDLSTQVVSDIPYTPKTNETDYSTPEILDSIIDSASKAPIDSTKHDKRNTSEPGTSPKPFDNFHTIDSDIDLDVPEGIEGPIPNIVAPPPGFFWIGETQTQTYLHDYPPEATLTENPARFANWSVVEHDLLAQD